MCGGDNTCDFQVTMGVTVKSLTGANDSVFDSTSSSFYECVAVVICLFSSAIDTCLVVWTGWAFL